MFDADKVADLCRTVDVPSPTGDLARAARLLNMVAGEILTVHAHPARKAETRKWAEGVSAAANDLLIMLGHGHARHEEDAFHHLSTAAYDTDSIARCKAAMAGIPAATDLFKALRTAPHAVALLAAAAETVAATVSRKGRPPNRPWKVFTVWAARAFTIASDLPSKRAISADSGGLTGRDSGGPVGRGCQFIYAAGEILVTHPRGVEAGLALPGIDTFDHMLRDLWREYPDTGSPF